MLAAAELVDELDGLSGEEKQQMKSALADLAVDTPTSSVAALRFKRVFAKATGTAKTLLLEVIASLATDAAKKGLGI